MKPGGPLQRRKELARTGRLRQRSARTERRYVERRQLVAALLEAVPWCPIRWDDGCQGRTVDVHEPGMRCRGADILDEDQCTAACRYCHDKVHDHPAEATARGWMIPSGRPVKAVAR